MQIREFGNEIYEGQFKNVHPILARIYPMALENFTSKINLSTSATSKVERRMVKEHSYSVMDHTTLGTFLKIKHRDRRGLTGPKISLTLEDSEIIYSME